MGSLMAGWSSQVLADEHKVRLMRNRSVTKEEVEAFWRQQRRKPAAEDNGGETITSPLASCPRVEISPLRRFERMSSLPPLAPSHGQASPASSCSEPSSLATRVDGDGDAAGSPSTSRDWWTRSSWAFLNEPPRAGGARAV